MVERCKLTYKLVYLYLSSLLVIYQSVHLSIYLWRQIYLRRLDFSIGNSSHPPADLDDDKRQSLSWLSGLMAHLSLIVTASSSFTRSSYINHHQEVNVVWRISDSHSVFFLFSPVPTTTGYHDGSLCTFLFDDEAHWQTQLSELTVATLHFLIWNITNWLFF